MTASGGPSSSVPDLAAAAASAAPQLALWRLVHGRGCSHERYRAWLGATMREQLP